MTNEFGKLQNESNKNDLVTGIPITPKKIYKISDKLSLFFEYAKLIQRIVMVILTIVLIIVFVKSSNEIRALRIETARIATIAERGCIIAEQSRQDILREIDEIQKDGIKLHFRIW
jgi:hypothetical protein